MTRSKNILLLLACWLCSAWVSTPAGATTTAEEMNIDAKTWTSSVVLGWNLGNSLESKGNDETAWGNPMTTREMIKAVKAQGFNCVRIPVQWGCHLSDEKAMTIDSKWMNRVEEVVNYCLDEKMKVIINTHHEVWLEQHPFFAQQKENNEKLAALWKQIATHFKDYGPDLAFAGINETQVNWQAPTPEQADVVNSYNQTFINAVRATGGNNAERVLIVQTYSCNPDYGFQHFVIPNDPAKDRLCVEFHYYNPYNYCSGKEGSYYYWGQAFKDKGKISPDDESQLTKTFDKAKTLWADKGLGVIIGELGVSTHFTTDDRATQLDNEKYYLLQLVKEARSRGFAPIVWDNNTFGNGCEMYGIFNRNNHMSVDAPWLLQGLQLGAGLEPYKETAENGVFWEGDALLNWGEGLQLKIPANKFNSFTTKGRLMLTIEQVPSADYEQLQLMYGDWSGKVNFKIDGKNYKGSYDPKAAQGTNDRTYSLSLSFDAATLAKLQTKGLIMQGYGVRLKNVIIMPQGMTTAIFNLAMTDNSQQRCYDLTGRTVPDSFRGLIIKDRQLCLAR